MKTKIKQSKTDTGGRVWTLTLDGLTVGKIQALLTALDESRTTLATEIETSIFAVLPWDLRSELGN